MGREAGTMSEKMLYVGGCAVLTVEADILDGSKRNVVDFVHDYIYRTSIRTINTAYQ